jgi:hypothetical protein
MKTSNELFSQKYGYDIYKGNRSLDQLIGQAEIDVISAYYHHANAYINKPLNFDQFINIVKSTARLWLGIVKLLTK